MIKINYSNAKFFLKEQRAQLKSVFMYCLKLLGQKENFEINLSFVSESEIQILNKENRNNDSVTDVLSFPSYDFVVGEVVEKNIDSYVENFNPETNCFILGDIIICLNVAKIQAENLGHQLNEEIVRLALHSFLHCFGYDHIEDEDYDAMHKLEQDVLEKFNITME